MSLRVEVRFTINGTPKRVTVPVTMSALSLIRDELGLIGTKYGCGEGECGACTIMVDGVAVNSCLMFAVDCDGREITTVEGVVATRTGEVLRDAFVAHGAVQCGFCTPGMMVQAAHVVEHAHDLSPEAVKRAIEGNLCRCTGYVKIVDAIGEAAAKLAREG